MKNLIICCSLFLLASCTLFKSGDGTAGNTPLLPPGGLEGAAYDPANSPEPMTAATPLPIPPGAELPSAPAASVATYGATTNEPVAYEAVPLGQQETPPAYQPAAGNLQAKSASSPAPATYGAPAAPPTAYAETQAMPNPYGQAQSVLSGRWVNDQDPKEVVEFTPTHYKTYYEGEMLVEEDMTYHPECPGDCSGGQSVGLPCFTISGPAQTDCYGIVLLTAETMELSLLGVSTETIVYRRIQ